MSHAALRFKNGDHGLKFNEVSVENHKHLGLSVHGQMELFFSLRKIAFTSRCGTRDGGIRRHLGSHFQNARILCSQWPWFLRRTAGPPQDPDRLGAVIGGFIGSCLMIAAWWYVREVRVPHLQSYEAGSATDEGGIRLRYDEIFHEHEKQMDDKSCGRSSDLSRSGSAEEFQLFSFR